MSKEPSKQPPSKTGIETEIQSEGYSVFMSFTDVKTGKTAMLKLHRRAAAALWALLGACDSAADDAGAMTASLRGSIEFTEPKVQV
jgi:hypothetical protein